MMKIKGKVYRLTNHARLRYHQRVNKWASDYEILMNAVKGLRGFKFIWRKDKYREKGFKLITVLRRRKTNAKGYRNCKQTTSNNGQTKKFLKKR